MRKIAALALLAGTLAGPASAVEMSLESVIAKGAAHAQTLARDIEALDRASLSGYEFALALSPYAPPLDACPKAAEDSDFEKCLGLKRRFWTSIDRALDGILADCAGGARGSMEGAAEAARQCTEAAKQRRLARAIIDDIEADSIFVAEITPETYTDERLFALLDRKIAIYRQIASAAPR